MRSFTKNLLVAILTVIITLLFAWQTKLILGLFVLGRLTKCLFEDKRCYGFMEVGTSTITWLATVVFVWGLKPPFRIPSTGRGDAHLIGPHMIQTLVVIAMIVIFFSLLTFIRQKTWRKWFKDFKNPYKL